MTAAQKCVLLTAVASLIVMSLLATASAFSFGSENEKRVSVGGAELVEREENGVTTGTCSYKNDHGMTLEVSYTKDQFGRVTARSRNSFVTDPNATYRTCLEKIEELKRKEFEAAGMEGGFQFAGRTERDRGQSSSNTGGYPSQSHGTSQGSYNRERYPSQNHGASQGPNNRERYPSQNHGASQGPNNRERYPSQNHGASQGPNNRERYPSQSHGASQGSSNTGSYPSQSHVPSQGSNNRERYPSQSQGVSQTSSSSHSQGVAYNRNPNIYPSHIQTTTQTSNRQNYPPQDQGVGVTQSSYGGRTFPALNQATTQPHRLDVDPTEDEGVTQTSYSNGQVTTQSSRIPSQSGAGTQTSQTQRPNQIQMVFQTSSGSNLQFQENTHRGTTTGQCSYVDRTGRTIRISYTKRADGTVNVETNPVVWRPMAAYRSCIAAARDEEKRLNREMSKIESDMRRQEQSIEEEVARQENAAMGGGGSFWG
ncbi:repetin-like isoform X3 [Penaeus japonicus]|nr:repetin-like isoform X3 [Penaeus japonicus]